MSTFENYDHTSQHYDETRRAVGTEIILGCLASLRPPMHDLTVLDAGCGTGAYSQAVIDHVGRIEAIDMNQGMLATAESKLAAAAADGRIRFSSGSITALPFETGSVDAVMINQVVHHLGDSTERGFPQLRQAVAEFARVLRPGGGLLFNHCSQEQLRNAYWYGALIPQAVEQFCSRFAPLPIVQAIFAEAGLVNRGSFAPVDAVCQGAAYFDGRGPLDPAWRAGDSIWALVSQDELDAAQTRIRDLDATGQLDGFLAEQDQRRSSLGQITIMFATRV